MSANNIRALRERSGLRIADIAKEFKISHTAVAKWEKGKTMPRASLLPRLAKMLNCKVDDFFCHV